MVCCGIVQYVNMFGTGIGCVPAFSALRRACRPSLGPEQEVARKAPRTTQSHLELTTSACASRYTVTAAISLVYAHTAAPSGAYACTCPCEVVSLGALCG